MDINADVFRRRYSTMETETLIELQWNEELTECASGVLEEVLKSRGVTDEMRAEITRKLEETRPRSGDKRARRDVSKPLKTKWLRAWAYFILPLFSIQSIYFAMTISEISFSILSAIIAIIQLSTVFGLYHRRVWAWRLNWILLLLTYSGGVIGAVTLPIFIKKTYGVETSLDQIVFETIIGALIAALIWLWPNYAYWKKRKGLFVATTPNRPMNQMN